MIGDRAQRGAVPRFSSPAVIVPMRRDEVPRGQYRLSVLRYRPIHGDRRESARDRSFLGYVRGYPDLQATGGIVLEDGMTCYPSDVANVLGM